MGKFSESSYKILDEYLDILKTPRTGSDNSYLLGSRKTIVSKGGNDTILYQKTSDGAMVSHRFLIQSITDNYFKFQHKGKISTYSDASDLVIGEEIYFRKDSYFHEWLRENIDDYENFVNTNKTFIYFGKIYPVSNEVNTYNIIFEGLKDFAINALPEHNQTDKIKELFKIFFDSVYHDIYNMTKTLWSFFDAKEVNIKHLDYLASRAGIETDKDKVSELPLREFVDNLIYWLKRKGTYTSYYIIYKLLLKNTKNKLNFYERWVEWCLRTKRKDQNWISDSDFDNHHVLEYYGVQPSGGAGSLYYDDYHPGNYPVRHTDVASDCSTGAGPIFIDRGNTNHKIVGHAGVSLDSDVKKFGKYGIKFDGTDDYISIANHSNWDIQTNFSIDLWVKHTDHVGDEVYVSQYEGANDFWVLYHHHGSGIYFFIRSGGVYIVSTPNPQAHGGEITDTNEHHILMAKKGNEYGIYLDGNQVSYLNDASMATFTGPLNIGLRGIWGFFDGHMDDVRIYHGNPFNASPNSGLTNTIIVPTGPHISDSKTKLLLPGSPKGVLSPHYKVEIDLSSEPLGEDYIIDENTITELIRYWEYLKPVSKFVHYHMLLSPPGKIDENNESVSLYDSKYTAICDTRFTGTITVTAASAADSDIYEKTEKHIQNTNNNTWTINHSLKSPELLIQEYDYDNNVIYPKAIDYPNKDVLKIDWNNAIRGTTYLAGQKNINTAYYNTSGSSAWDVVHSYSPSGIVYQVYSGITNPSPSAWRFHDVNRIIPNFAESVNKNTLQLNFSNPVSGAVWIRDADYCHSQNTPSLMWSINHKMDIDAAIVQCWGGNNKRIYPKNIKKINSNKYEVIFSEPASGYATLIAFERAFIESNVDPVYWKIGTGSDYTFNPLLSNDLNSCTASGELSSFTDTVSGIGGYHIMEFNVPKEGKQIINEFGVFDINYNMLYYTSCSSIYKPDNVQFDVVYRITKQTGE